MGFLGERKAYISENYYPLLGLTKMEAFYGIKTEQLDES